MSGHVRADFVKAVCCWCFSESHSQGDHGSASNNFHSMRLRLQKILDIVNFTFWSFFKVPEPTICCDCPYSNSSWDVEVTSLMFVRIPHHITLHVIYVAVIRQRSCFAFFESNYKVKTASLMSSHESGSRP
jgi:hypothetical protein